jgi:hypothetical protein
MWEEMWGILAPVFGKTCGEIESVGGAPLRLRRTAHRAPRFPEASRAPRSATERLRSAAIKQTNGDQGNSNAINQ